MGAQQISGNLSVVNGDDIRVTCDSDSHPAPHSYKWTGQSSDSNILTINNIHSAVTRTCTATNTMTPTVGNAESRSSSAALDISVMSKYFEMVQVRLLQNGCPHSMPVSIYMNDRYFFYLVIFIKHGN